MVMFMLIRMAVIAMMMLVLTRVTVVAVMMLVFAGAVSYTHLTLPTILRV